MAGKWSIYRGDDFVIDIQPLNADHLNGVFDTKAEALEQAIWGLEMEREMLSKSLARLKRLRRRAALTEDKAQ